MENQYIIKMTSDGEGITDANLGDVLMTFTTRFNYYAESWVLDLTDATGNIVIAGIMLVPNIDLLYPYPEQKGLLGALVLIEKKIGDYLRDDKLGLDTKLIWYPPGTPIVLSP